MAKLNSGTRIYGNVTVDTFVTATGNVTGGNITTAGAISTTGNAIVGNILTNGYYYANGVVFGGGGGGGTPGGANTQVQFNDNGTFGGNGQFVYNKVTNIVTAGAFAGNTNGTGQNFQVGDDAWIGDINIADTIGLKGQQNPANCYIVFGNSDATGKLGRAGTGPLTYAGAFSATGNITGGNITTAGQVSATGNVSGGNINVTGNIVDTGALSIITGSNGNITLAPNGTGVTIVNTDLRNGQANGVGNIGTSTVYFNTAFVKATSAQYADLAEMYQGDESYMPGTVVEFGGTQEVTITTTESSPRIAGIVSTNPSYLMNSGLTTLNSVPVALTGRVPCQVLGPVRKGDRLVSSVLPGVAQTLDETTYRPGCMIGKSLEDWSESTVKLIEVVVGRL